MTPQIYIKTFCIMARPKLLSVDVRLFILKTWPRMKQNRSCLVDTLRKRFPHLAKAPWTKIYGRVRYFLDILSTTGSTNMKNTICNILTVVINGERVGNTLPFTPQKQVSSSYTTHGPRVKKIMERYRSDEVSTTNSNCVSTYSAVTIIVNGEKHRLKEKVEKFGRSLPLNIAPGSDQIHPVYVLSDDEWNNIKHNSILVTGLGRNYRNK